MVKDKENENLEKRPLDEIEKLINKFKDLEKKLSEKFNYQDIINSMISNQFSIICKSFSLREQKNKTELEILTSIFENQKIFLDKILDLEKEIKTLKNGNKRF